MATKRLTSIALKVRTIGPYPREQKAFNPQDGRDLEILIMASGEASNEATKSPATHSQDDFEKQDHFICPHLLTPFNLRFC